MDLIRDAANAFVDTNANVDVIQIENLVKAGKLPEWSDIYVCPSWFGVQLPRRHYDDAFRSNLFLNCNIAANYSNCSYYIEICTKVARITGHSYRTFWIIAPE